MAWSALDKRYFTAQRPSQQLIQQLLHGPTVNSDEPGALSTFAEVCEAIVFLKSQNQTAFASLDEWSTQQAIYSRLAKPLFDKWYEHQWVTLQTTTASFEQFSGWINGQARVTRMKCDDTRQIQRPQPQDQQTDEQSSNETWQNNNNANRHQTLCTEDRPHYSRTCPVKITHPSTGRTAIGLAIIDDHSTITFMDPQALDMMEMPNNQLRESSLATITVQGTSSRAPCHLINGLIVSPLEGDSSITLPPTYIQNTLPSAIDQVPSRKAVASTPGFKHLADRFPAKDVNWPTLLLIGRDCVEAQHQKQIYS